MEFQKGKLKEKFQNWGDIYAIKFDIVVNKLPGTITNVFCFTAFPNGDDIKIHGNRIPALFVKPDGRFHFRTSLNDDANFGFHNETNIDFVIGEIYHVVIKHLKVGSKYRYKIIINDEVKKDIENHNPRSFSNVHLYTSEPFWDSFTNEFGKVCNFKVLQDAGEFLSSSLANYTQ